MNELIHKNNSRNDTNSNELFREDEEAYRIRSKIYVLHILREIMKKNTPVTLYFDQSNRFILTTIVAIDAEADSLLIDYGIKPELNALALKSCQLIIVSSQDKVKVKFACHRIKTQQYEDRSAFSLNLPESLIRLQRRKDYRLTLPVTQPLKGIVPITIEENIFKAEIKLVDICCGGISFIDNHPNINFKSGTTHQNCQINLPGVGYIKATIKIKGIYEVIPKNGHPYKRIGCQFVSLPPQMEAMIQRYVTQQEQLKLVP